MISEEGLSAGAFGSEGGGLTEGAAGGLGSVEGFLASIGGLESDGFLSAGLLIVEVEYGLSGGSPRFLLLRVDEDLFRDCEACLLTLAGLSWWRFA